MHLVRATIPAIALCLTVIQPAVAFGPGELASPGASGDHATHYYLALGDSLSVGVQPIGAGGTDVPTLDGYADQLWAMVGAGYPKLKLVKLGCPGESTVTMIHGGRCPYDAGSQLDQAVEFLHAHRTFVDFVTVDIGFNDFPCTNDVACLAPGAAQIAANLPTILQRLRAAAGPDTPIIGTTIYDPFLAFWLTGPQGQALAQASVYQAVLPLNAMLTGIYVNGTARVADVQGAFYTTDFATQVQTPLGPLPKNVATVCAWTWSCVAGDNHANPVGYHAMAEAFATALQA